MTATRGSVRGAQVGASGFSYPSWRPGFYPAEARPEDFLRLYAQRLPSVELNVTGYRVPHADQFERWASQVPDGFTFAVKMPPRALRDIGEFERRVRGLGDRLGPIRLVVDRPRDEGLLALLLGSADPSLRYALDLRDASWAGVDVRPAVRVGDEEADAPFRYLRYRDPPWPDGELADIAGSLRPLLAERVHVFAYFRHEDEPRAPLAAERLLVLLGQDRPAG